MNNQNNDDQTAPDMSGQASPELPSAWVSVPKAARYFIEAGMPRNKRTIRRYCERGDLDCRKTENALHQPQYFIEPNSITNYIAQQRTLLAGDADMSGLSRTKPDQPAHARTEITEVLPAAENADTSGPARTAPDMSGQRRGSGTDQLVEQLKERLTDRDHEIEFLRGELLHRRTTDTALHDVIAAFRANAEAQRLAAGSPERQGTNPQGT